MDKVHSFLNQFMKTMRHDDLNDLIRHYNEMKGYDWIDEYPDDKSFIPIIEYDELLIRSALEFIRPELTEHQIAVLDSIDAIYKKWIDEGIFYERYSAASGGRFTWKKEREMIGHSLGHSIPKSHWWLWPPKGTK